jgi:hypothetical protein
MHVITVITLHQAAPLPRRCLVSDCNAGAVARGLCRRHYDGHRRKRPGWHHPRPDRDEFGQPPWCECETPAWRTCGPWFPDVHCCARCGSPDRNELGLWPSSLTTQEHT